MPASKPTTEQIRAVVADLEDYLMGAGSDEEIAIMHDVDPAVVTRLRVHVDSRPWIQEARERASNIAHMTGSNADVGTIVLSVLDAAVEAVMYGKATLTRRGFERAQDGAQGRSAGPGHGQSARTTKRAEGASGLGSRGGTSREAGAGGHG